MWSFDYNYNLDGGRLFYVSHSNRQRRQTAGLVKLVKAGTRCSCDIFGWTSLDWHFSTTSSSLIWFQDVVSWTLVAFNMEFFKRCCQLAVQQHDTNIVLKVLWQSFCFQTSFFNSPLMLLSLPHLTAALHLLWYNYQGMLLLYRRLLSPAFQL